MAPIQVVEHKELKSCSSDFVYGDPKGSYLAAIILAVTLTLMTVISISLCLVASQQKGKLKELQSAQRKASKSSSSTKESTKHVQIVPPTDWQKPGNSPLRHVEPVSPVSSTASSEYEGFSESAPPSDGYYGSNDQSFTARTERMVAEVRTEQDGSNRVSDKPPQIPRYPFQGSGQ
ncbi:hypothetical protein FOPG_01790 [Fusarium oxysporum f. sp. conglutinans race 2 54008]|nr:hypothetical protein FOPG_01790 [Fusarium oxysporum f. sp. conglutinans race 2 54008]EXM27910.1 hypothetical protein FOTG_06205 [Fusarium oxysporum f. sp. vasinfectum 25433]KAG6992450.1 hypothetical protein FocnCong_v018457 [Fusarium oxysporum f. sp. conglutinans]KAI8418379.1 hypothetical protein FOFC_00946 [Fusarium oxysporum]KAK2937410.1 hypothetical protein FoTM2_000628 [Fusarium oxysporum f. sp. vasinfectum]